METNGCEKGSMTKQTLINQAGKCFLAKINGRNDNNNKLEDAVGSYEIMCI